MSDYSNSDEWQEADIGVLFDSASGIYIPLRFAEEMDRHYVQWDATDEDWTALLAGPDHESYWDVWQDVLDNARLVMRDKKLVRLFQDGDVFYVDENAEYDEDSDQYYVRKTP